MSKPLIALVWVGYFGLQLFLLPYSPLPWFDEVFFADMSYQFWQKGSLSPSVAVFRPLYIYGFVHFGLSAAMFELLGFGIVSYRLSCYLGALAVLYLLARLLHRERPLSWSWYAWALLVVLLDPFFNLSMHEGRMDLLALALWLAGLAALPLKHGGQRAWLSSACWFLLALLTTPRVGFMGVPLALLLGLKLGVDRPSFKQHWRGFLLWAGLIVGGYALWVVISFGGFGALLTYLREPQAWHDGERLYQKFLGFSGYIPRQQGLLIPLSLMAWVGYLGVLGRSKSTVTLLDWQLLGSIPCFYLIVYDVGPYAIFILPSLYWPLLRLAQLSSPSQGAYFRRGYVLPLLLLFVFNGTYALLKNAQILSSLSQRNPTTAQAFVAKNIPPGSRVVAEPMYYYALQKNGSQLQLMNYFENLYSREARQRTQFDYEYLIVTEHLRWRDPQTVAHYLSQADFVLVDSLFLPPSLWAEKLESTRLLSPVERTGYSALIYRRLP
ncbi:hypothetical protein [Eisenibacter elegans]|uniref:hypothetical protein n=1 Tax=Eisenibacter elegans TaxID=997 RepID=UPI0012B5E958|nr:hypothetical protein [Eisenibacter elegans]